jgi:hypothetical protein
MTSGLSGARPIIALLERWENVVFARGLLVHRKEAIQNPKAMFFAALFALSGNGSSVTILTLTH